MGRLLFLTICIIGLTSCGYHFQGRQNSLKKMGVEKIFITQFTNKTYRPGVEQLFSTAMIREIQKFRSFTIVSSEEEADAVLSGDVTSAATSISSSKSQVIGENKSIATEYNASVTCSVWLTDRTGRPIFSQAISSNKIFPGAGRIGDDGATNALVNESEQRLAIQFLASQMMSSVYQRMIDTF